MSVTEAAIGMGLVGMGALAAASLSGNMSDSAKKSEGIVARSQFASALGSYLYTGMGCHDLKLASGAYTETPRPIALTNWKYMGISRFEAGVGADGKSLTQTKYFTIDKLEAYTEELQNAPKVKSKLSSGVEQELTKTILRVKVNLLVGKNPAEYIYNVPVLIDSATGSLGYCTQDKTITESCATMRGVFDPATQKCKMSDGCLIRGSFAILSCPPFPDSQCDNERFSDNPDVFRNPFTMAQTCPLDSVREETSYLAWTSDVKVGKKGSKDVNNNMTWYSCMKCPD